MARSQTRSLTIALVAAIVAAIFVAPVREARADTHVTADRVGAGGVTMQTHVWIDAEARRLSGRRLTVACAAGAQEWARRLTDVGLLGPAGEYYGFSLVQRGEMHLSPYVCEGLRLGASAPARRSHELQVAWSVNVLIHESVHLARFSTDEKVAEACARIALPGELHRLYGVEYHSAQMRRLTSAAAWFRRSMPPAYQGGTCSAPGA
jgi:hypothetical protein